MPEENQGSDEKENGYLPWGLTHCCLQYCESCLACWRMKHEAKCRDEAAELGRGMIMCFMVGNLDFIQYTNETTSATQ